MNLFEQYQRMNLEAINKFIDDKQEENLHLDFKLVNKSDLSHSDDKKNLAKALSGFANSDGGLIVWGINAKKNSENIDCAQDKIPLENVHLFLSRLNEFTGKAVNPIVERVQHKAIIENDNSGYAVSYIPPSDSGPHMAKLGEDRYYKRSGDSFYKMEHFDIADMFGKRRRPELILKTKFIDRHHYSNEHRLTIHISLENIGRGPAVAPFLSIETPSKCVWSEYGVDGNGNLGLTHIPTNYRTFPGIQFGNNANTVIHPTILLEITNLRRTYYDSEIDQPIEDIIIKYKVAAEGLRLTENQIIISGDSISNYIKYGKDT